MSYISSYLKMVENTEPPLPFHQWSCLSSLSVLAGRRFWFNLGPIVYYPNLYVVLVGNPGVKKSSAMNRSKDIARHVGCCPIAATQSTKEAITLEMSSEKFAGRRVFYHNQEQIEYNQFAIFATELTQFIGVNPLGMLDFLTTVYDEKVYEVKTKNKGNDYIKGPYITLLACMTPEIVKGYLKMNILTGGFARRTVFVHCSNGEIIPIPDFTKEQKLAMQQCIDFGKALQDRSGEFKFSPEGQKWYVNWYNKLHRNMSDIAKPSTEGYYRSKHELLFKTSMLIALSESDDLILHPEHFEIAEKRFFAPVEKTLERVFEGSGINANAGAVAQVCHMLEGLGKPMNYKHLLGMFMGQSTSLSELKDMIDQMCSVGRLKKKDIIVNGNILGTVIGTPESVDRYSDVQLATFLRPAAPPPADSGEGPQT